LIEEVQSWVQWKALLSAVLKLLTKESVLLSCLSVALDTLCPILFTPSHGGLLITDNIINAM
jgi:hypothetical protein